MHRGLTEFVDIDSYRERMSWDVSGYIDRQSFLPFMFINEMLRNLVRLLSRQAVSDGIIFCHACLVFLDIMFEIGPLMAFLTFLFGHIRYGEGLGNLIQRPRNIYSSSHSIKYMIFFIRLPYPFISSCLTKSSLTIIVIFPGPCLLVKDAYVFLFY